MMSARATRVLLVAVLTLTVGMAMPLAASASPPKIWDCHNVAAPGDFKFTLGMTDVGCVETIQAFLNDARRIAVLFAAADANYPSLQNWDHLVEDGDYGDATRRAVWRWKRVVRFGGHGRSVGRGALYKMAHDCWDLKEHAAFLPYLRNC